MRILHVVTDTDRRGAQLFAHDLHVAMTERGHDSRMVALAPGHRPQTLALDVLGPGPRSWATLRELRRRCRAVDVVVAHGSSTLVACAIACPFDRPFVYRQISDTLFWANTITRRLRVAASLRRAAAVVALSRRDADALARNVWLDADRTTVVPNAVRAQDWPSIEPTDDPALRVLVVSALVPEKGVDQVITAIAGVEDCRLTIAGDGPERERLERLATTVADGRVTFLGDVRDLQPAYVDCDVLVLASRGGDSMPAVLIEAAFVGRPSIATRVGAIPEMIEDGRTGLLVDLDEYGALQSALATLSADREECRRLGRAASKEFRSRYEIEGVAGQWLAVLERVVGPSSTDR